MTSSKVSCRPHPGECGVAGRGAEGAGSVQRREVFETKATDGLGDCYRRSCTAGDTGREKGGVPAARGWGRGCGEGGLRRFCRGWTKRDRKGLYRTLPGKCFGMGRPGPTVLLARGWNGLLWIGELACEVRRENYRLNGNKRHWSP